MRKVMYEDCNNNVSFLKDLFSEIQLFSDTELNWSISNLEVIPIDKGDSICGILRPEMELLYNFQKKVLEEHSVIISHNFFMSLLKNIRTIYEGNFISIIKGKSTKVKVFDGDIIEIDGEIANLLKL